MVLNVFLMNYYYLERRVKISVLFADYTIDCGYDCGRRKTNVFIGIFDSEIYLLRCLKKYMDDAHYKNFDYKIIESEINEY